MSAEKNVAQSMATKQLLNEWMMFVNAYKRQEFRLRMIQVAVSPFGRTEKVFYSEESLLDGSYDKWYTGYLGRMQEIGNKYGFIVTNNANLIIDVDMSPISELTKVTMGDHTYQSAKELHGNEFDSFKKYVLEYKTHKDSLEDVTEQEWHKILKEIREAYKRVSVDFSNKISEYTKTVNEIQNLCDNAYEDCKQAMEEPYRRYYEGVTKLAVELQELDGRPVSLNMWGEWIELYDFDSFYSWYTSREMSLDEIRTAKRTLEKIIVSKQGEL